MMKIIKPVIKYCYFVLSGLLAFFLVLLFYGSITFPYLVDKSGASALQFQMNYSLVDLYFLFNLLILLPIIRYYLPRLYSSKSVAFETYKDKAMKLHHQDIQNNHKGHSWTPDHVTSNPWEYSASQTQSYGDVSTWGFNIFKNSVINILVILVGILFLIPIIIRRGKQTSKATKSTVKSPSSKD